VGDVCSGICNRNVCDNSVGEYGTNICVRVFIRRRVWEYEC
jgi:hypothetical protein